MYDDFENLDYTCEDNSFNYDDEFYEELDENYSRAAHTDYQELVFIFNIKWHQKSSECVSVVKLSQRDLTGIVTEDYRYYFQAGGVAKFVQ